MSDAWKLRVTCYFACVFLLGMFLTGTFTGLMVEVRDDADNAVSGARVSAGGKIGVTDDAGSVGFVVPLGTQVVSIRKDGHYNTYMRSREDLDLKARSSNNRVFHSREKRNPVPLIGVKFRGALPVIGGERALDLFAGDWVAPHGDGKVSHLIVKTRGWRGEDGSYEVRLIVTFPDPGDGIRSVVHEPGRYSDLRLPYYAPEAGYSERLVRRRRSIVKNGISRQTARDVDLRQWHGYFLRIATQRANDGRVLSAHYAKIRRDLRVSVRLDHEEVWLQFDYLINPRRNERNLEFDVGNNLFERSGHERFSWPG